MAGRETYISITGQQPRVGLTVNNDVAPFRQATSGTRQVLITPLRPTTASSQQHVHVGGPTATQGPATIPPQTSTRLFGQENSSSRVDKVLLKAVNKKNKKDPKTFTVRNLKQSDTGSCDDLKRVIRRNLSEDITSGDFDVGYLQGSVVVRIRSADDLKELWSLLKNSQKNTILWCDGLSANNRKRKNSDEEDSDIEQPPKKTRYQRSNVNMQQVQDTVDQLKAKHGAANFTQMQFRIWAELIVGGMGNIEGPPVNNSMFTRAGNASAQKKSTSPVAQALTDAATAITSALKPPQEASLSTTPRSSITSPAKLIENRSKLYKQLSELKVLKSSGVLNDEEYTTEKATIMDLLKQLGSKS